MSHILYCLLQKGKMPTSRQHGSHSPLTSQNHCACGNHVGTPVFAQCSCPLDLRRDLQDQFCVSCSVSLVLSGLMALIQPLQLGHPCDSTRFSYITMFHNHDIVFLRLRQLGNLRSHTHTFMYYNKKRRWPWLF